MSWRSLQLPGGCLHPLGETESKQYSATIVVAGAQLQILRSSLVGEKDNGQEVNNSKRINSRY